MATLIPTGYSCDTSSLIHVWKSYPREVFRELWSHVETLVTEGRLQSPLEVFHELEGKEDDLHHWAKTRVNALFVNDVTLWDRAARIVKEYPDLVDFSRTKPQADPFVIALAQARGWTVITEEGRTGPGAKLKIPAVCSRLGVKCGKSLDLIRLEGWKF
ncbi:MAG: DUF4411 family protein [Thermoplasmata archaeon]